jgi:hypothetical protein
MDLLGSPLFIFVDFKSVLFEWCSGGIMGHWIAFLIYPQDGRVVVLDSLRDSKKEGYKDLESVLRLKVTVLILFTLNICVTFIVDTSGFHTALTRSTCKIPSASIQDLRRRRRIEWHNTENQARFPGTYQKSYVLLHRACSLYFVVIMCHISCSAPNNLLKQYYVDTTFASILERAANSATGSGSSRNHKAGGGRRSLTIRTSLKQ